MARSEELQDKADTLFVDKDARKCSIVSLRSYQEGGVHLFWEVTVLDTIGNEYVWEDWDLGDDPSVVEFQTAIYNSLVKRGKYEYDATRAVTYDTTTNSEAVIDANVGDEI